MKERISIHVNLLMLELILLLFTYFFNYEVVCLHLREFVNGNLIDTMLSLSAARSVVFTSLLFFVNFPPLNTRVLLRWLKWFKHFPGEIPVLEKFKNIVKTLYKSFFAIFTDIYLLIILDKLFPLE